MSSTIKLKKSSIAGRVPSASDLEYGEIAINIADGKLYFKNSSNAIQSFEAGDLGVDSAAVLSLIDSAHIQARQIDEGLDSAEVNTLIASGLQNAFSRILVDGQFDVVSDSTQDGLTLDAGHNITITTVPNDDTITFTTSAIGADSVTSLIDSSYVDVRLPSRMVTLTDSQELSNKTLAGPVLNSPVFGTGTNSPTFTEIRFNNSNIMKFNQMYTGASSGSYFSNGEYQKVATITPDGNSQNYQVVGRITAQNAGETHTVYFNAALRSNTLPDLNWSITYNEEYTGNRYIDPQLWTKETTTAGFIFAFKTLATIYGTVTVDFEVIPRTNAQLANVTVNSTQNSEQSSVDTGFTARDMTRTHAIIGNNVRLGAYTFPTADGNANQVLGTNGSGTLQFVNQTSGMDSASTIALVDSAYVQARQSTASDFDSSSAIGLIDSAYIQARQVDLQRDSAFITGLIDSSYIQARDNAGGTTVTSLDRSVFTYTTTSNQTVFTGADSDGNTLAFNNEVDVYLNGILLKQSDYVLSGGNTVTLGLATSADNILTIVDYGASVVTIPSQRTYEYTATANQTTFTGSDDNGNTLSYDVEKLNVYVNGILLATEDYTATNTTSVILTVGAAANDIVQVVAWKAATVGELDSDATIALIDSAYVQARQLGSEITIQDEGSSLSTAATTLNFVGAAVTASGTGTTKTITITQAEGGTDSATVSNIIAGDVDSAYVQARQSTADLTNYRTVTQIQSMIDSDIDAIVDAAPGALDTLNELAAALGDDANFSTTVTNSIAAKIDSAQAIALIDSAHVALHSAIGKGDIDFGSNKITYSNVYSTTSDLPSASDYHGMFAHVHATGKGYFAHGGNWIELANHSQLANSSNWDTAYGWGDHSTQGYLTDAIDSARVTSLIDSSYVQARQTAQDFAFSSLTGTPTTISGYGITDAFDGAFSSLTGKPTTISGYGITDAFDGAYSSLTGVPTTFAPEGVDSSATIALIDSAYVQARQNQAGGTDSAAVVALIDSNYIQARQANASPGATTIVTTNYTADSGDTSFAASYTIGKLNVYLNGILLVDSDDYTASNGSSVVLTSAADSGDTVQIISYVSEIIGTLDSAGVTALVDSAYVNARVAAGTDSSTVSNIILSDVDSAYVVARNGFSNLRESNGTLIASGNILPGADSTYSIGTENLKFKDLYLSGGTIYIDDLGLSANNNGTITIGQLDSAGFTPVGTIATVDSTQLGAIVDSAYLAARLTDFVSDTELSAFGYSTFDSTNAVGLVDSAYVQARQSTTDLTNYRTVTQIESMIDSNVNAVIDAAPGALNTLNELAAALGDDANFSTTVTNSIAEKIDSAAAVGIITSYGYTTYDSSATLGLIDSAYVQARQTNGYSEGTVDAILVDGNSASDTTYDGVAWTAGSDTSGLGYNQGGGLSWNSTNGRVTVSSGGLYEVKFHAYFTASGGETGNQRFQLWKNGSNYIGGFVHKSLGTGETAVQSGSATIQLNAGDYIQIKGASSSSWRPRVYGGSGHTYLQVIKQENGVLDTGIDSSTITSIIDSAYVSARAGSSGVDSASTLNLFSVTTADPFAVTVGADSASFDLTSDVNHTATPDLTTSLERNGLLFSDDGTVMYLSQLSGNVYRYTLSTAFDPESYTQTHSSYIDMGTDYQSHMHRTTGGYLLSTNVASDVIRLFTSSDGFDTFSYVGNSTGQIDTTDDGLTNPKSAQFNADGTVLWVYDAASSNIGKYQKYTLSTGYDLSTASYQSSGTVAVKLGTSTVSGSSSSGEWFQFAFNNNGKIVFEYDGDNLALFRLATAYDLSSAGTLLQSYSKTSFVGSISNSHTAWQWVHTSSKNAIFTMPRNYDNIVEIPLNYTGSEGTPANPASLVYSADSGVYTYTPPKIVDSADVISLIDSAYIQARQSTASDFDSNSAIGLIDSAYIQARQNTTTSLAFSAITSTPTTIAGYGITDALQLGTTATTALAGNTSLFDGAFSSLTGTPTTLAGYGITDGGGTDSASVIALIDSDYVQARQTTVSAGATTVSTTTFTATAGQTTFTTNYTVGKINVYLNGILLVDTSDYTASNGTSVVLGTAAVANDILQVVKYTTQAIGTLDSAGVTGLIDSDYVQARQDFAYGSLTGAPTIPTNNNQLTNGAGYITGYTVTESDVTGHEAALTITESQISDLGTYLTSSSLTNYRTVTQIQSMIDSDLDALVDAAPGSLNTLNELAAALGDDANFSTTVTNSIAAKLPLAGGTMTGAIAMGSNKITGLGTPTATTDAATKAYADTMLPLAGGTMSGNIDLDNNELLNINYLRFNDPGVEEGIGWTGGNGWQIFEAPNAMTNASGNLQFTTGSSTSDRMMTIDTNGNLELPTGRLTQVSDDPLRIRSSTNASPVSIEFSDLSTSNNYDQYGTISYTHSDAASTSAGISGANEVFIIEGSETVTGIKLDGRLLVTGTSEFQGDVDFGSNQITYSNVYSQTSDLPSASTYHGMFAHVHATGKGYFAHSGNWVELANNSDVPTDVSDLTDTTSLLGTGGLDSDATTDLIDSNYIAARTGNNSLTVNYVPDRKYARLTMSSDQTGISTTVALTTFNTRDVDTSPNNALTSTLADGKFIIPAGVSKIRLSASCKTSSVTDQVTMTFWKNGTFFTGTSNIDVSSTGRDHAAAFSGIIDVVENDYFQIAMFSQNSRTAEQDELSWFELEVIEGSMLNTAVASTIELSNLSNVDSASPSDGQALVWDSDNNYWKPGTVASSGSGGLDSASTIALIDSAYIQARQTTGGSGTVDSADIIAIVDSDYIQARQSSTGSTTITSGGAFAARTYHYTASANQTNFTGADDNGDILAITDSDANVYLNGILLMRTTDYTVGSNSITLQSGADSDNIISIVSYTGNHLDSNYILSRVSGGATTTTFTATANQTIFSGGGFTYKPDNLTVFYNGILLLDSDDYTATDGTSITLTSGATAGHKLTAVAYTMGNAVNGVDVTTSTFTATAGQTVFNNFDDNGNRLSYNVGNAAIYLNGILLSPADYTANNSTRVVLTEAADSGNILTVMSYAGSQQTTTADSSSWYEVSTSTYSAAATDKLFVDVSSAAATVTLPTSPSMGDEVRVIDATGNAATNNITIGRNGSKINGADSDLTLDIDRAAVGLVYYNAAQGWILMER